MRVYNIKGSPAVTILTVFTEAFLRVRCEQSEGGQSRCVVEKLSGAEDRQWVRRDEDKCTENEQG